MRMWLWLIVLSGALGGAIGPAAAGNEVVAPREQGPSTLDCRGWSWDCPALIPRGESIDISLFRGMADPSVRQDPASGRLWMAYSWPNMIASRTPGVQLHLARSDDQGDTWTYDSTLLTNPLIRNPITGVE
jgi:hypothetical protein